MLARRPVFKSRGKTTGIFVSGGNETRLVSGYSLPPTFREVRPALAS